MNRVRIILRTDDNLKIGGVRQIYRHVDVLNQIGIDAAVVHPTKGFKCSWFENDTKTIGFEELSLDENDYLVLPELDPDVPVFPGSDKCKVVVLVQNPFGFLRGFGGLRTLFDFYRDRVSAIICVSEHSRKHLQAVLPDLKVHRIRYSFDKPPFTLGMDKQKVIAVMPRRRNQEIDTVLFMLDKMGLLQGWRVVPIIDLPESVVADVMRQAMIFMAGGYMEGFGMPAAEAMSSGCVVAGWHGYGGEEAFHPEYSRPVPDGDVFSYVEAMQELLSKDMNELKQMGQVASACTRREYSTQNEVQSITDAWNGIMGKKEDVMSLRDKLVERLFPLPNVAAYMMANEENAYIERIIRWLSVRVGTVFIVEGEKTYSGSQDRDSQIESLVKKLVASGVTNIEHIVAKYVGYPNPAINETHMRNEALDAIQRKGFEWVWIVDSDEVYTDAEAERLWRYFIDMVLDDIKHNNGTRTTKGAKCSWHTYWRSIHWKIDPPEPYRPNIILRSDCRFSMIRNLIDERNIIEIPPDTCMVRHYSWAKPPSEIEKKIKAWGHAHQVIPQWYENVFLKWEPGCDMRNLHPTEPPAYQSAVRCNLPTPDVMIGHPYRDLDLIDCDDHESLKVKVIIMNHDKPENADKLYEQLASVFDDVEIWDSGSKPDKIPIHTGKAFPNIYWTGIWNEAMRTCSDYDAVWILGCDITLLSEPIEYRNAIESSLPFGCWSPCLDGRGFPFMRAVNYAHGKPMSVRNIEGMAMAVSGKLMRKVQKLVEGSPIGFGQDLWLSYQARRFGMKNIIDGRVKMFHPEETGYDMSTALNQMNETFSKMYGPEFRRKIFEFDDRYEANLMTDPEKKIKPITIVSVDNGWGYAEFIRVTSSFPDMRKIVMVKGVAELAPVPGIEVIKYDPEMEKLLKEGDIAFFPKVGAANKQEYVKLLQSGMPTVVHVAHQQGLIEHMKNGFFYQEEHWAVNWLRELIHNETMRNTVRQELLNNPPKEKEALPIGCGECAEKAKQAAEAAVKAGLSLPLVTVITPTYKRDPKVLHRSIDCLKLQTVPLWEQLVCSDGEEEQSAKQAVSEAADPRVSYYNTTGKKEGDFGNTVRSEMLKIARGKYVLFLDDDNIILPDYLELMIKAIEEGNVDFAVCRIMHFGPLNEAAGKPPIILEGNKIKLYHIDPLQILVNTKVMRSVGWDTEVGYLSDGVSLEKLGDKFKHIRVEKILGIHI